jgi:hypothetical protein
MTSVTEQRRLREAYFKGKGYPYQIHHYAERRISKALGLPDGVWNKCPGIALPTNHGVPGFNPTEYLQKFGHPPIYHKTSGSVKGIADEITNIMAGTNGPLQTDGEKKALLGKLRALYLKEPYKNANMWPATRDWLRKELHQAGMNAAEIVPD